ncbi:MAG: ABC transporter ATP-binding protein [Candidatus Odinarchaeota archaeon]|nr:ABC transporter ATP-binding protein [Candidatus Odinarchaeota archaeon]
MEVMIKTVNLTKIYAGYIRAVDNLNLEIYSGETFGLLGPNGAGKTTTIRILNAIIKPTSGKAFVGGYDVVEKSDEVKRITGLLPESAGVYEKLTAREFLTFIGKLYDVDKSILSDRINDLLELFDLDDRADDLLESYSRGMKQKVLLACALVHDPPILFLDEPTATLDPASAKMVKDMIKLLVKKVKKTVVIATHILTIAQEICDRVGIIDMGSLRAVGTPEELMEQTETETLEDAFIRVTGRTQKEAKELLGWLE